MKRKRMFTLIIALAAALIIAILILGRRPKEDGRRSPRVLPPEWQDYFRDMEDGLVPERSIDEVLDEIYPGGVPNGQGR